MKIPEKPMGAREAFELIAESQDGGLMRRILGGTPGPLASGKYLHWDQLKRREPPEGLAHAQWWAGLKIRRGTGARELELRDAAGRPFTFSMVDPIVELVYHADRDAAGQIKVPEPITNPQTRDRYLVSSIIEEAIRSSQLEGAATTRKVAADMLRSGREPRDKGERMILNNYVTMRRIQELATEPLGEDMLFDLHSQITEGTLEDADEAGRYRRPDEVIRVYDADGTSLHDPPPAAELPTRMTRMFDFANGRTEEFFVHPLLKAVILHFWLAYEHPFTDGNGRTARALFYWMMLKQGYWMSEYISISSILSKAPVKYARSFLYTETDENDLNYFIIHQLEVFERAVKELHEYIRRKSEHIKVIERQSRVLAGLNHRQKALILHALRKPGSDYTIRSHQTSHNTVYQTARRDLQELEEKGLLVSRKISRELHYAPARDLQEMLGQGAG